MNNSSGIKHRFSKSASTYDNYAFVQREVAKALSKDLPLNTHGSILEIGSGTGLMTAELIKKFPDAELTITDLTKEMLSKNQEKYENLNNLTFKTFNPETETIKKTYDLIVASMVIHWFEDIPKTLAKIQKLLKHQGSFYFTTIGKSCFPEWQKALKTNNLPLGLRIPPEFIGLYREEQKKVSYQSAYEFLKSLSQTGTSRPRKNYKPLRPKQLKQAMHTLDKTDPVTITWDIQYAKLSDNVK